MIREAVDARRQAVRELLLECLQGRSGYDSDALADVLTASLGGCFRPFAFGRGTKSTGRGTARHRRPDNGPKRRSIDGRKPGRLP